MNASATTLHADTDPEAMLDAIDSFIGAVVLPLEEQHSVMLENPRLRYAPSGGYIEHVLELKRKVRTASAEAGFYGLFAPAGLGGRGGTLLHYRVWEHLFRCYGPDRVLPYDVIAPVVGGPTALLEHMSSECKRDVWPKLAAGEKVMCVALSELQTNNSGTSSTTAVRRDGQWHLSGIKNWVTRGPYADYALVFAATDRYKSEQKRGGVTAFLVNTDTDGFQVDSVVRLFGRIGGEEAIVSLSHVRVPDSRIVGEVHAGLDVIGPTMPVTAMYTAGRFVGLARWALEQTVEFVPQHVANHRLAQARLADAAMGIYAAHQMALDCGRRVEAGEWPAKEMAMVRAHAAEMCARVYEGCMQVLGGTGLTNEAKLFDGWHQARTVLTASGTDDEMKCMVAQELANGNLSFGGEDG